WRGISTSGLAGACTFAHVIVKYGGSASQPAIKLVAQGASLTYVTVQSCQGAALDLSGFCRATVSNCAFNNDGRAIDGAPFDALPLFTANTASGNAAGNSIRVTGSGTGNAAALSIGPQNTPNGNTAIVIATNPTIGSSQT